MEIMFWKRKALKLSTMLFGLSCFATFGMQQNSWVPQLREGSSIWWNNQQIIKSSNGQWYTIVSGNRVPTNPQPTNNDLAGIFTSIKKTAAAILRGEVQEEHLAPGLQLNYRTIPYLSTRDRRQILQDQEVVDALFTNGIYSQTIAHAPFLYAYNEETFRVEIDQESLRVFLNLRRPLAINPTSLLGEACLPETAKIAYKNESDSTFECLPAPRNLLLLTHHLSNEMRANTDIFPELKDALKNAIARGDQEVTNVLLYNITDKNHLIKLLGETNCFLFTQLNKTLDALKTGDSDKAVSALREITTKDLSHSLTLAKTTFTQLFNDIVDLATRKNKRRVLYELGDQIDTDTLIELLVFALENNQESVFGCLLSIYEKKMRLFQERNKQQVDVTKETYFNLTNKIQLLNMPLKKYNNRSLLQVVASNRMNDVFLEKCIKPFKCPETFKNRPHLCVEFVKMITSKNLSQNRQHGQDPIVWAKPNQDSQNLLIALRNNACIAFAYTAYNKTHPDTRVNQDTSRRQETDESPTKRQKRS